MLKHPWKITHFNPGIIKWKRFIKSEKYGEYDVEKRRKAQRSCEDPNDPHKKVFIDPVVVNVMKQVFPEMATEGIDPSPRIPMPKETPNKASE